MDLGLKNLKALVAGSTSGLGFACARALIDEGTKVCLNGRSGEKLDTAVDELNKSGDAIGFQADVTKQEECESLVENAINGLGGLDILVTNCGGPPPGLFENLSKSDWQTAIDQSFLSHIYLIRSCLEHLKKSNNPSILTITSFTVRQPLENLILSNSIRAATVALTKSLSKEFGVFNIRVNSVLPGWTMTSRVQHLINDRARRNQISDEEELIKITDKIPLGRVAAADEFGIVVAFLVSPASSYVNGVMLNVDGGYYDGLL